MNRIARNNFFGISLSVVAVAASSALLMGCGSAPAVKATGVVTPGPVVSPGLVVANAGGVNTPISSFTTQQQAQITALLGTYTGSFQADDANGNTTTQTYTITLNRGTSPSAPGQTFVAVNFAAGPSMSFTSLMQTGAPLAGNPYSPGTTYDFLSVPQTVTGLDADGPFMLNLQLTINSSNQFDPTQSPNPICIMDYVSFQAGSSECRGTFNNDFQRH